MTEPITASSSEYDVSMITRTAGQRERMTRHASMPLPPGMRMSIMTTSGCVSATTCSASAADPASPTTSKSATRFSSVFSPSRTTSWSSTMTTLIAFTLTPLHFRAQCSTVVRLRLVRLPRPPRQRHRHRHRRPPPRFAVDVHVRSHQLSPLPNVAQPLPGGPRLLLRLEAAPVVDDGKADLRRIRIDLDAKPAGPAVANRVGQRLPRDLAQMVEHLGPQHRGGVAPGVQRHRHAESVSILRRDVSQRLLQRAVLVLRR